MPRDPWLDRTLHDLTVAEFAELFALAGLAADVKAIRKQLARIEHTVNQEKVLMSETEDALDALAAQVAEVDADVARELTDLADALAGKLTDAEKGKFVAIAQKLTDIKTNVDTADPAPAAPADQP